MKSSTRTSPKKGITYFFHQQAAKVGTTMPDIASKLRITPGSLFAHIWSGTLPDDKLVQLAKHLSLSPNQIRVKIRKSLQNPRQSVRSRVKNKKGKKLAVAKVAKKPAAGTTGKSAEKKEGVSDAQVLRLIERLKSLGLAGRVTVVGLDYLCLLEQAQGQPLTDTAMRLLAELEGIMV